MHLRGSSKTGRRRSSGLKKPCAGRRLLVARCELWVVRAGETFGTSRCPLLCSVGFPLTSATRTAGTRRASEGKQSKASKQGRRQAGKTASRAGRQDRQGTLRARRRRGAQPRRARASWTLVGSLQLGGARSPSPAGSSAIGARRLGAKQDDPSCWSARQPRCRRSRCRCRTSQCLTFPSIHHSSSPSPRFQNMSVFCPVVLP